MAENSGDCLNTSKGGQMKKPDSTFHYETEFSMYGSLHGLNNIINHKRKIAANLEISKSLKITNAQPQLGLSISNAMQNWLTFEKQITQESGMEKEENKVLWRAWPISQNLYDHIPLSVCMKYRTSKWPTFIFLELKKDTAKYKYHHKIIIGNRN